MKINFKIHNFSNMIGKITETGNTQVTVTNHKMLQQQNASTKICIDDIELKTETELKMKIAKIENKMQNHHTFSFCTN